MERGLVVTGDSDAHRELLREAAENAVGTGADLVLLDLLDEAEYEHDIETLEEFASEEGVSYSKDTVIEGEAEETRELAAEVLGDLDVEYDVRVDVIEEGERAETVVEAGTEENCDHAYIHGRHRSPTGKALFGDFAQNVILNYDGFVTVTTE
ncbi:universal stress protein [Halorubrum sp. CBA1125]|uniref:universal stress protein n=1 Tax=Halorubrum sp. CBA1125 TaxID=2668072 RepID=UPI0012E824F2|nr:universal stress protein [Halorubrum sp. CBA1125]MUW13390.1 universal stress protein [Halorubrum sp. CBA1125]